MNLKKLKIISFLITVNKTIFNFFKLVLLAIFNDTYIFSAGSSFQLFIALFRLILNSELIKPLNMKFGVLQVSVSEKVHALLFFPITSNHFFKMSICLQKI
ncbi:hypothetical protein BpHYR1_050821 [Brachionus plicatilis]|uniref:Uncharacterized protein n=1 Tax=Brachionus plicatilis TaxID=10195 RepID=A0A3M7T7H8_BRAPC|nr:hypothetical protein BpHYR1_050821 [Brachionus plicatilis]